MTNLRKPSSRNRTYIRTTALYTELCKTPKKAKISLDSPSYKLYYVN